MWMIWIQSFYQAAVNCLTIGQFTILLVCEFIGEYLRILAFLFAVKTK